jgi:hypothetical protein
VRVRVRVRVRVGTAGGYLVVSHTADVELGDGVEGELGRLGAQHVRHPADQVGGGHGREVVGEGEEGHL